MVTVYNTPLSTTSEKALFGRPGGGVASGGMVAHDLVNGCQAPA